MGSHVHNTEVFDAYMHKKKVGKPRISPLKRNEGQVINNTKSMANIFCVALSFIYVWEVPDCPEPHQNCDGEHRTY